jgi:hypothetical protein
LQAAKKAASGFQEVKKENPCFEAGLQEGVQYDLLGLSV